MPKSKVLAKQSKKQAEEPIAVKYEEVSDHSSSEEETSEPNENKQVEQVPEPVEEKKTKSKPRKKAEKKEPSDKPKKITLWTQTCKECGYMVKGGKRQPKKGTPEYEELRKRYDEKKTEVEQQKQ